MAEPPWQPPSLHCRSAAAGPLYRGTLPEVEGIVFEFDQCLQSGQNSGFSKLQPSLENSLECLLGFCMFLKVPPNLIRMFSMCTSAILTFLSVRHSTQCIIENF